MAGRGGEGAEHSLETAELERATCIRITFLERRLAAKKQILHRQPQHVLQLLRVVLLRALSSHRNRLLHLVRVQHHNHHVVLLLCIL